MNLSTLDIERVVREVIAEIGAAGGSGASCSVAAAAKRPETAVAGGADAKSPGSPSRGVDAERNGDLALGSRVVTMEEVAGRLEGTRRVLVARGAVVTPAVRDELIRRGIALGYAESADREANRSIRLAMLTMGTDFDPTLLAAGLTREGLCVEHTGCDCLIAATGQLATEVARPDTLGVLLTRHTAAGLCLANRHGGVRAVTGVDAPAVAVAAAAVGANVLVVDPRVGTFFQVKQMVTEFCRGGVRPCPGVFRAQLA